MQRLCEIGFKPSVLANLTSSQTQTEWYIFFDILFGVKIGARKAIRDGFILSIWQGNLMPNLIPNIWIAGKAQIWARVLNSIVDSYS